VLKLLLPVVLGYLVGCINPAWIIAKHKKTELRRKGTNNLGATNVFLTLGKRMGVFVMIVDIAKAYAVIRIAGVLFPQVALAGVLAGAAVIIGHIFPFYLKFRGGKGSACLGGAVLGLDWRLFVALLLAGIVIAVIVDYAWALPVSAAGLFPFAYGIGTQSAMSAVILLVSGACIILKHSENFRRARNGTEVTLRDYLKGLQRGKA
jgi:glycerol-3-phosphate acyltransferase PlsY